jgi:hypothetical protein
MFGGTIAPTALQLAWLRFSAATDYAREHLDREQWDEHLALIGTLLGRLQREQGYAGGTA